jgi:hypothetical protein
MERVVMSGLFCTYLRGRPYFKHFELNTKLLTIERRLNMNYHYYEDEYLRFNANLILDFEWVK